VPRAKAQASGGSGIPPLARLRITGIIVAAEDHRSPLKEGIPGLLFVIFTRKRKKAFDIVL
jgi:hypothetical protein